MVHEALQPILRHKDICGVNLYDVGLGEKIEEMTHEMLQGEDAVGKTILKYVSTGE